MSRVNFKFLTISGFSSIQNIARIPLDGVGLCCIEGRVLDNETEEAIETNQSFFRSNGAGKSSIVEAFYFVLTGEFFDSDTTLSSILYRFAKVPAVLSIEGEVDDKEFIITRTIDSKTRRPGSKVAHRLQFTFGGENIHEQTNSLPQTQERINELLGITPLLLLNSKIFGQGDISSFTNVNDRQKKVIIDNLVGTGTCDKYCKASKTLLSETSTEISTLKIQIMSKKEVQQQIEDELLEIRLKETTWTREQNAKRIEIVRSIAELDQEIQTLDDSIRECEITKSKLGIPIDQQDELRKKLESVNLLLVDTEKSAQEETKNSIELETKSSFQLGLLKSVEDKMVKLSELYKNEGSKCPTCYQELTIAGLGAVFNELEEEQTRLRETIMSYSLEIGASKQACKKWEKTKAEIEQVRNSLKGKMGVLEQAAKKVEKANLDISRFQELIQVIGKRRILLQENLQAVETEKSPYLTFNDGKQVKLEEVKKEIEEKEEVITTLETDQQYFNFLVRAFDKGGIPQLISNDVLKILNRILEKYKNKILGRNFNAEYRMREKRGNDEISLTLENPTGGEGYSRQSKGEKRKIDLCQMFTISDFAKMQNKCNLNVIWFDEIFSELDPHSCESILDIIKEYPAKSKFIITHKDLFKDEFKNRIYVEKSGNSSSVRVNYLTGEAE